MADVGICDTNAFRKVGVGEYSIADLKKIAPDLRFSPVTPLELASKYTDSSFEHRKAAAQAILDSGATLLADPESYLTQAFGFPLAEHDFDWMHGVHAMAQSESLEQLQTGVPDFGAGVRRNINIGLASSYCAGIELGFVSDMLHLQMTDIPGFSEWFAVEPKNRKGKVPRLTDEARERFLEQRASPEHYGSVLTACMDRAIFKSAEPAPWPPTQAWVERILAASEMLDFYCKIYTQYLIRMMTGGMLPRVNDWFDLEIMMYSRDVNHVILTADVKWHTMAKEADMGERVVLLQ